MGGRGEEKKGYAPPESMKKSSNTLTPAPLDAAVSVGLFFFYFSIAYRAMRCSRAPGSTPHGLFAFCFCFLKKKEELEGRFLKTQKVEQKKKLRSSRVDEKK